MTYRVKAIQTVRIGGLPPMIVAVLIALQAGPGLLAQPRITKQPVNQSVSVGANVTFQVTAASTLPLTYQWQKEAMDLKGATNRRLDLIQVQVEAAGIYTVIVGDTSGAFIQSGPTALIVDDTFTKITVGRIVEDRDKSNGCAWGDYNNDGFEDLFVANMEGRNSLYRNSGDGSFSKVAEGPLVSEISLWHGCAWADYDNDGLLDLYVTALFDKGRLYRNTGGGSFVSKTAAQAGEIVNHAALSVGVTWVDYDKDGDLDLFTANGGISGIDTNFLYQNDGAGRFSLVIKGPLVTDRAISTEGAWADFDNDGDPDIFVTHFGDSRNALYLNGGDGTFTKITAGSLISDTSNSKGAAWGDYDNDGDLDLFVTNWREGPNTRNFLYRNNGDGTFEKVTEGEIVNDGGKFQSCAWGDYDNDGFLDLFIATDNHPRGFYHNNGDGTFTKIKEGSPVNDLADSVGCAWADYDNDGFLDLFVANGRVVQTQPNNLYRNNGNRNGWLKIRCIGTVSNRSAIGARLKVKAAIGGKTVWQLREISGGSGYMSQNSLITSFGLGDANVVETLRIEWPSGLVQEMHGLQLKQALFVVEPFRVDLGSPGSQGLVELQMNAGKGRAFQVEGSSDLLSWKALGLATNTAGMLRVADPEAEGRPQRFYRIRMP